MGAAGIGPALLPLLFYGQDARPLATRPGFGPTSQSHHHCKGGRRESNPRKLVHSQSPGPLGYDHHTTALGQSHHGQTRSRTPNLCVQNRCVPITPSALNEPLSVDQPKSTIQVSPCGYSNRMLYRCNPKSKTENPKSQPSAGAQGIEPCLRRFGVICRPIWPHPPVNIKRPGLLDFGETVRPPIRPEIMDGRARVIGGVAKG
jgi:hypothetical protein